MIASSKLYAFFLFGIVLLGAVVVGKSSLAAAPNEQQPPHHHHHHDLKNAKREIFVPTLVEAIEDDVKEAGGDGDGDGIDVVDIVHQQKGRGSIRGRQKRRAQQSISEGFKMIQAVMDDGSPFPAGPHRKRICVPDTG